MTKLKKLNLVLGQEQSVSADALQILALIADSVEEGSDIDAAVYSEVGYAAAIEKLQAAFPNLRIRTVKNAIWFEDPEVRRLLLSNSSINKDGDEYILVSEAEAVTALPNMRGNTVIKNFDELEKFTGIKTTSALGGNQGQFQNCTNLESVRFPDSITTNNATFVFGGCSKLSRVKLPSTLKTIGSYFFYGCSALDMDCEELIPQTVESIGQSAFQNSAVRGRLNVPNLKTIAYLAFFNSKIEEIVDLGSITSTPTTASTGVFQGCVSLRSVVLPPTLVTLDGNTFYGCSALTTVSGGINLSSIGASAFRGCSALVSEVNFPNLTTMGISAFNSSGITKVVNLGMITTISGNTNGEGAFRNCKGLEGVAIPNTVTTIAHYAFSGCSALSKLSGGENVREIQAWAFQSTGEIEDINFPNLETCDAAGVFGSSAIKRVSSLGKITILGDKTTGNGIFQNCTNLQFVTLPSTLTRVGNYNFRSCSNLEYVDFGHMSGSIGAQAFAGCGVLTIANTDGITRIESAAFSKQSNTGPFGGPQGVVSMPSLTTITGNSNNFNGPFARCPLTAFIAPSIETISSSASGNGRACFEACSSLKTVILGERATSLGSYTWYGCSSLETFVIRAITPPSASNIFQNANNVIIYVPTASVDTYKAASGWSSYATRIKGYEEVEALPESGVEGAYYLKGENLYRFTSDGRQVLDIESGEWRLDL